MTTVRKLHHEAMELVDAAELARACRDSSAALELYTAAQKLEQSAADLCVKEPSKSILLSSAENIGKRIKALEGGDE